MYIFKKMFDGALTMWKVREGMQFNLNGESTRGEPALTICERQEDSNSGFCGC
jgi:hypothetical protein